MADDHHEPENLADLLNSVLSGRVLEERNEDIL